ncbi:hypothetical protein [Paenibacillus sp. Leaf72]|uniref:hypothetical protein n=1 Tax=Paenibacillus sp. Leaf72 TaxID=1736234 RepID=UPI0012DFCDF5|nr:hypothetical protein [Paenibacillus sp. Leaf72]
MKATEYIPAIPGIGLWGYIPHLIPFLICLAFAHVTHPSTGMGLFTFIKSYLACRMRKRTFL